MNNGKLNNGQGAPAPDYDFAAAYVTALTGSLDTVMDWRCLHDSDPSARAQVRRGKLSDVWPWLTRWNAAGYGCFVTVNETDGAGRSSENITSARAVWVDLDGVDARQQYEAAVAWSPAPSFAVQTSGDKSHVYWTLAPGCPLEAAASSNRRLRVQFNGDRAATDLARVLRVPGTLHRKAEPVLVTCHQLRGYGHPVDGQVLDTALADVVVQEGAGDRQPLGDATLAAPSIEWLRRALELVDPNDLSRDDWLSLTSAVKQAGWSLTDEATLRALWDGWCEHYDANDPAENSKVWRSIDSTQLGWHSLVARVPGLRPLLAFGNGPPPLPAGASATPLPVAANDDHRRTINAANLFEHVLAGDDEPLRWHIEGLIPEDGLIPIHGPPKQGKTFVAIDMGASVAEGSAFHGRKVAQGTVFYICGEGFRAIKQRFAAWSEARGVSLESAPLFRSRCAVPLLDAESAAMLSDAVAGLAAAHGPPRLIVVDTLNRNFGPGDENSTSDMTRFIAAIDQLRAQWPGCSVIVVHHSGLADTKRARGSSALLGAADAEFRVESNATGPALFCTAMKDAAPGPAMQFELVEASRSVALEYIGEPNSKAAGKPVTPTEQMAFDAFHAAAVDGSANLEAWRAEFYERHGSSVQDTKLKAFNRGREGLVKRQMLETDAGGEIYSVPPMPGKMADR